ncbi:MAG: hypothetical protein QW177_02375 [Candidatus Nitrosotenuis sp.]
MARLLVIVMFVFCEIGIAYAFEPIPITVSHTMSDVIFDGKWTHEYEWKASSLNTYKYENDTEIVLRTAHQGDFVYVFLDPITDYYADPLDHAIICFDTENNKSEMTDDNDYCFVTYLDGESLVYQGNSKSDIEFDKIENPDGFIAKSTVSDVNDRYTPIPHPSYEFRIPTELIGRHNVYGFYFGIYDEHTKKTYTYPQNLNPKNFVAMPMEWGEIYSPDKSLPEFELPTIALVVSITSLILLSQVKQRFVKLS